MRGGYFIPLHEFHRAIIYGDNVHYDPSRSPIANILDITTLDPKEHFLQPIIIAYLLGTLRSKGLTRDLFPVEKVYEYCQGLGFIPEQIDVAIIRVLQQEANRDCCEAHSRPG